MNVVPAFSVKVTPPLVVIPAPAGSSPAKPVRREVHVTVTNGTKGAAQASVAIELPAGWKATPASVPLEFAHEDESLSARFTVTAPAQVKLGEYTLRAVVTRPSERHEVRPDTMRSTIRTFSGARISSRLKPRSRWST